MNRHCRTYQVNLITEHEKSKGRKNTISTKYIYIYITVRLVSLQGSRKYVVSNTADSCHVYYESNLNEDDMTIERYTVGLYERVKRHVRTELVLLNTSISYAVPRSWYR